MSSSSVGSWAERKAALYLEEQGYKILQRNYRCRSGEVDLVCEDVGIIVFVEVRWRARSRYGYPEETITYDKLRNIVITARHYLATHKLEDRECRFDVVAILGDEAPQLQRDAFRAND